MNRAVWKKTVAEAQWLWVALALLLTSFCLIRVWIVSIFETSRLEAILVQVWDQYQQFFAVSLAEMLTYPCRVGLAYTDPVMIVAVAVWAVARGSAAVSGELSRGTMEMLLAQPVSRLQTFCAQATVTLGGLGLLAFVTWIALCAGVSMHTVVVEESRAITIPYLDWKIPIPLAEPVRRRVPMKELVVPQDVAPGAFNLFALGVCMAGIATLASSFDRYRWRTIGVATGVIVFQYVLKGVALADASVAWLGRFTFFTAFEPLRFVAWEAGQSGEGWTFVRGDRLSQFSEWGPMAYSSVLLAIGVVAYLVAGLIFSRRDLPAPL